MPVVPHHDSGYLEQELNELPGLTARTTLPERTMDTNDAGATPPPASPEPVPATGITPDQVRTMLRRVKDPELNLNIVDLGLVYDIAVNDGSDVHVQMTLTSPGCPSGPEIMSDAQRAVETLDGVRNVDIELVWTPYWTPERIDPRLRAFLGG